MKDAHLHLVTLVAGLLLAPLLMAAPYPVQETADTGGEGTVKQSDHNAFSLPQGNLPMTRRLDFSVGNSFFRNPWVAAPASTDARDGLGPLFNTNSCQGCHIKDGRGNPPDDSGPSVSLFLRLSIPADPNKEEHAKVLRVAGFLPDPIYGAQLQTAAIAGMKPEADLVVEWEPLEERLDDGTLVSMRRPVYTIENPNYGPLSPDLLISPRVAPQMIGLGLLQAIPQADLDAAADPDDDNQDGISGRVNQVWDRRTEQTVPGRFGWKAGEPDVMQQSMAAFAGDLGVTSSLFAHDDCTPVQGCDAHPHGGVPEVSDKIAGFIEFYASSLAVPARRNMDDPKVRAGAVLFNEAQCAACHTPRHTTGDFAERPDLSNQVIWPYTDLLLHDMGPGLADHRDEFLASGTEWRTPPLWGIGLAQQINPRAGFLHDGRARTLEEAILWHDGESRGSADNYRALGKDDREALIRFLESL